MQTNEQMLSAIENYLAQTEFPAEQIGRAHV